MLYMIRVRYYSTERRISFYIKFGYSHTDKNGEITRLSNMTDNDIKELLEMYTLFKLEPIKFIDILTDVMKSTDYNELFHITYKRMNDYFLNKDFIQVVEFTDK